MEGAGPVRPSVCQASPEMPTAMRDTHGSVSRWKEVPVRGALPVSLPEDWARCTERSVKARVGCLTSCDFWNFFFFYNVLLFSVCKSFTVSLEKAFYSFEWVCKWDRGLNFLPCLVHFQFVEVQADFASCDFIEFGFFI